MPKEKKVKCETCGGELSDDLSLTVCSKCGEPVMKSDLEPDPRVK